MASALTESYGNQALRVYAAMVDGLLDAWGNEIITADQLAAVLSEMQGRLHAETEKSE